MHQIEVAISACITKQIGVPRLFGASKGVTPTDERALESIAYHLASKHEKTEASVACHARYEFQVLQGVSLYSELEQQLGVERKKKTIT